MDSYQQTRKLSAESVQRHSDDFGRRSPQRLWWLLSLPLLLFLTLPLVALFLRSTPAQVWSTLQTPVVSEAILLSLRTSLAATLLTILLGTPLAFLIARRSFPGRKIVLALVDLPIVLPPAVAGLALLMAFGRSGIVGPFLSAVGLEIPFTWIAVVLAQTFVASPFFVSAAILGFSSVEPELTQAAALDGASQEQMFRHIFLPLSVGALVSGAVMTWARALGEFGATIIFAGNLPGRTQTMPLAIYLGFELNLDAALTMSVILLFLSFIVLTAVRLISPKLGG